MRLSALGRSCLSLCRFRSSSILILVFAALSALDDRLSLGAGVDGDVEAVPYGLLSDISDHFLEHIETLICISHCRVKMSQSAQSDTLLKVVHSIDVIHPAVVNNPEHDHLFHFSHAVSPDFGFLLIIESMEFSNSISLKLLCRQIMYSILIIMKALKPVCETLQVLVHHIKIPFLCKLAVHSHRNHDIFNQVVHHIQNVLLHIVTEKNFAALVVDNLSLLVHYVVVLENVFTDFEVTALNLLLSVFDGLGKHPCSNRFILHAELIHDILDSVSTEEPHQIVFQGNEELGLTRVSLTSGTASQLIIYTS